MGCFLSCFRGGSSPSGDLRDPLVGESRLGDAFLNDENKFDGATVKLDVEAAKGHGVDEELRREANYLKSCGTISQTPSEILDPISIDSEDANECGDTPTNVQQTKDVVLVEENSSERLNSDDLDVSRHKQDTDEGTLRTGSETQPSLEDKPSCHQNVRDQITDSSDSPYPTPLVLRGDIQTPGTVYAAAYKETSKPGKRTRAFIYPVLRPIENKMQWMELKAESPVPSPNPPKRRNMNMSAGSVGKAQQQPLARSVVTVTGSSEHESFVTIDNCAAQNGVMSPDEPKCRSVLEQQYGREELSKRSCEHGKHGVGVASLSHWLKALSADDESNGSPDHCCNVVGKEKDTRIVSDVPIFPAFGLNWETDNPTPVLPKAWDGNGIPNTTTKYKEDQKVSWHATPFEERLLKVLSDEKPRHERRISGKLIHLEENAE